MADLRTIVQDPNYVNANAATKRAIFDKYAPSDPNYVNASPATQKAIRLKFGVEPTAPAAKLVAAPEETFGQQVLAGAASTADIIAESAPGFAAMVAYPFRRAAGLVTGETAEDIAASQERVMGSVSSPVGRMLGVTESPSYKNNMIKQALGFVSENMDKGADWIAGTDQAKAIGLTKPDVVNMMQVIASAAPAKVPGGKTVGRVTQTTVNKVRDIMDPKTKFYMDVAEGRAPELIAAARSPQAEIIPGVRPTFAQATADVGLPRVAAVGEQAAKLQPTEALRVRDAQEAARVGELRAIEQTPEVRAKVEAARERRAGPLYQAAETAGDVVDVTPTLNYIGGLIDTNPGNPQLLSELRALRKGLTRRVEEDIPVLDADGNYITNKKTGEVKTKKEVRFEPRTDAKEIASTLDGLKTALADEKNTFIKKELTNIKDDLTEAIPSMKEAQAAFRKGSKPLNQMDVGKYLREKLESAVPEGTQRAGVFAEAVRQAPQTIKRALSGAPRYAELTDVLSPPQKARVDRVLMDLSRDARVKEMAQLGRETAPKLAEPAGKLAKFPPFIKAVFTVANEILRRLEGKINEKMAMDIAMEFLDADRAAAALETAMRRSGGRSASATPRRAGGPVSRVVKRAPVVTAPNTMAEENRNSMAR